MKKVKVLAILVSLAVMVGLSGIASAGTLDEILKRGEIRIACQTQGAPFSFVDRNGERTGSSVELTKLIRRLKTEVTILLVEQNVNTTLHITDRGYVLEQGQITLEGESKALLENEHVRKAFLGV